MQWQRPVMSWDEISWNCFCWSCGSFKSKFMIEKFRNNFLIYSSFASCPFRSQFSEKTMRGISHWKRGDGIMDMAKWAFSLVFSKLIKLNLIIIVSRLSFRCCLVISIYVKNSSRCKWPMMKTTCERVLCVVCWKRHYWCFNP